MTVDHVNRDYFLHLDFPREVPKADRFPIQGWVISQFPVAEIWLEGQGQRIVLAKVRRLDVAETYPNYMHAVGFAGEAEISVLRGNRLSIGLGKAGGELLHDHLFKSPYPLSDEQKQAKLQRLSPFLACPNCREPLLPRGGPLPGKIACRTCGKSYPFNGEHVDFLDAELRSQFKIKDTGNVSANDYDADPSAVSLIRRFPDGLILDCGAGRRDSDYPNVINYEIVGYPSTDVLGVAERLPFVDNTFDAAFSFAVLEHVSDPFTSAKELARVLKPGGVLYCVVPFLQPVHGYPNHFYNMTAQGLRNLFDEQFEVKEIGVPQTGLPIYALTWILNSWSSGLKPKAREQFLNLRIADLLGNPASYLAEEFVSGLSADKNFELACTTMLIAEKRGAPIGRGPATAGKPLDSVPR